MTKIAMRFVTTTDIPIGNALVAIRLTRSDYEEKTSGVIMPRLEEFHTDANGLLQVDLMPATALYHVTVYDTVQDIAIHHDFIVPEVENPNTVLLLPDLIVPPDTVFSSQPYDEKALAIIVQAKTESVAAAVRSENSATSSAASALAASTDAAKTAADRTAVAADRTRVTADATQVATDKLAVSTNAAAALASKNAAATSAAEALASKNAAATSATGASGSATAAGTSATAASGSAATAVAAKDTAVTAKDQAAASQTAAANSAAAALVSQTSATQSATTATTAATTATTAKNDSLTYKDQAFQYMTSAQAAKGSAEGSAAAALASANSATASATTATGARDVAVDAKNKAEAAWTDFDKRYFGAFAANPTVNAHGTAPVAGSMYWNIPLRQLNVFENGVWTPLPFTSTEVPLASALVRTQANGYIKPGLLDPNQTIYTDTPLAVKAVGKYGCTLLHAGQSQLLYKIATLPTTGVGTYASLRIDAMVGNWAADSLTAMTVTLGTRGAFSVDWTASVGMPTEVKFLVFVDADGSHSVYVMFNNQAFAQASFDLHGMGCQSFATPVGTSSVTGTAVWDSAANPGVSTYKAPRSIGMSPGKGTSFDSLVEIRAQDGVASSTSYIAGAPKANTMAAKQEAEFMRIGVSGNSGVSYAGFFNAYVSVGEYASPFALGYKMTIKACDAGSGNFTSPLFSINGYGVVYIPLLKVGSSDSSTLRHNISRGTGQGSEILYVGVDKAAAPSVAVLAADGAGGWSAALSVMYVGKNSTTNRGIATPGTVNAQGTDYAEYFVKALSCGPVAAGQLVGVDNKNQVTDLWAEAVMFAIKSTDPSFVGGDSWSSHLGNRPAARAGVEPVSPARMVDVLGADPENPEGDLIVTTPGDTDEEWEAKMAEYSTALDEWQQVVETDRLAQADFDAKLEVARARVDRIAIAGRVPVNVYGANPGDYIIPVQDGEGIKGIAVKEDDMTLRQYLRAVGQVITIEEDGRAYVMVKAV